ncbi:putative transcriptional regulator, GntR family [Coriobacterium glomerans PW2]|uniref:Transcriptional regulator, GntR family n=1 Tax=Coriobacterium glomerans (strain ATCC 49209 / DSM 20642 / JCM 10262 / PW2) TaxID=700015 RepID=F2N8Z7_CORGP|nr:PLP-dependent aminotransferase family protein [Coriobacterium glomerans]AEB07597.1 putative transcriptional regulator, GntR family [Coriobacterium glomerans PW2]
MPSATVQFDAWEGHYARRLASLRHSAVRDLFAAVSRPDVIGLSGGMPDISVLPLEQVAECAADCIRKEGVRALQYAGSLGRLECRRVVCDTLAELDIAATPDDVILTGGSQSALDLLAKIFIDPGDVIITEGPTYLGALQAFSAYEPRVIHIELDENGMRVDLLEERLRELGPHGAKFIYTIPSFQNPSGVTMSLDRRTRLIELSRAYEIPIIEDDPYGRLRYEGDPVPAIKSMDSSVIYLGTVSKIFAPGLRLAWVVAPHAVIEKVNLAKQGACLCTSPMNEVMVERYFTDVDWHATQRRVIALYRRRRDAMLSALAELFPPEVTWTHPAGGFFIWVTLPRYFDSDQLLSCALKAGVAFVPGAGCFYNGEGRNSLRIAFCYEEPEVLREGIRRLAEAISDRMDLYRAFLAVGALPESPQPAPGKNTLDSESPASASASVARETPDRAHPRSAATTGAAGSARTIKEES